MTHDLDPKSALWWQRGVIYQIYPRSYMDSNGDGIGDLDGITAKIDYLGELGIDAIWLSPFFRSPMKDFGYDVSDYCDVDPIFGDLAAFDRLVAAAHERDIHIVVDYVPNHTSDQHPWFLESSSSRDNPKADWYVWGDPAPDGTQPNNWLSVFGGIAWSYEDRRNQYYLHSFLKEQPDLNWRNPEVKAAMLDVLEFWMKRGVDGFRIDVAHFIMKDPEMRDNPVNPDALSAVHPLGLYDRQLHPNDKGHADVHGVFREIRALLDRYSENDKARWSVGEIHVFDWDDWATYYGNNDELHMPFNFAFIDAKWDAAVYRNIVEGVEAALAKRKSAAWPNYVLGNHDENRIASRIGAAQARVALMLLLTLRGTPTIYYGDEIGMLDVPIPYELRQDPWTFHNRDPERTPMQWSDAPNAGFTQHDVKPWLPVADDYSKNNVAAQWDQTTSMFNLTRRLLTLREGTAALHAGTYQTVPNMPEGVYAYLRETNGGRILVALNFTDQPKKMDFSDYLNGVILVTTHMDHTGDANLAHFQLRPNEGCVVML